jgi:dsDNA-binding SOS-regulon protein
MIIVRGQAVSTIEERNERLARIKAKRKDFERRTMEKVTNSMHEKVGQWLVMNDFEFFMGKFALNQAAKTLKTDFGLTGWKLSELTVVLKFIAKHHCKMWRAKMKPASIKTVAESDYWDKLKYTVEKLSDVLSREDVTISTAERIIRLKISTNKQLMRGLPARLQYWNH